MPAKILNGSFSASWIRLAVCWQEFSSSRVGMNAQQIIGSWNVFQGKLKQKWAKLTADELVYGDGKEKELLGKIQKRAAKPRSQKARSRDVKMEQKQWRRDSAEFKARAASKRAQAMRECGCCRNQLEERRSAA